MKVLLLDTAPAGDCVLPVAEPLRQADYQCPKCQGSFSLPLELTCDDHRPERLPYSGRVALSVPCPTCDGGRISPASYVYLRTPCPTCQGKGRLITHTAMVKFVPVMSLYEDMPCPFYPHVAWGKFAPAYYVTAPGESIGIIAIFTPGQWAAVLSDVRPTAERCPACWGEGERQEDGRPVDQCIRCSSAGTCLPISHDGSEEKAP